MSTNLRKIVLATMIVALAITAIAVALPLSSAYAAAHTDTATPPAPGSKSSDPAQANLRLEMAFAREQFNLQRISLELNGASERQAKIQKMIDTAKSNGKDTTALQAAFDALKSATTTAQPFYDQAKTAASVHAGFDASGKVTNAITARATLKTIHDALQQYRQTVGTAVQNLRTATEAFRLANPRPTKTPKTPITPTSTGG